MNTSEVVPTMEPEYEKPAQAPATPAKRFSLDTNNKEKLATLLKLAAEAFKVVMACLLVVFVPQYCPETGTTCTMSQNFSNLSRYNEFCLFWNFFSLACMCIMYFVQVRREWFIIEHLDADKKKSDNNWEEERETWPEVHAALQSHNNALRISAAAVALELVVNFIVSAVLILRFYYDGFRSVTTLLANTFLVLDRVKNCLTIGHASHTQGVATSSMLMEPVSFNTVDSGKYTRNAASQV